MVLAQEYEDRALKTQFYSLFVCSAGDYTYDDFLGGHLRVEPMERRSAVVDKQQIGRDDR